MFAEAERDVCHKRLSGVELTVTRCVSAFQMTKLFSLELLSLPVAVAHLLFVRP